MWFASSRRAGAHSATAARAPTAWSAPEAGLAWWAYAGGARSLILDLDTADGRRRALEMARRADIVLESFPPGYLDQRGLGWERSTVRTRA